MDLSYFRAIFPIPFYVLLVMLSVVCSRYALADVDEAKPGLLIGAQVYADRCLLCHGPTGAGQGILPMKLTNYPDTNLRDPKKAQNRQSIHYAVVYGGSDGKYSHYMPPMGNDLTWTQTESVVDFVALLRSDYSSAKALLAKSLENEAPNRRTGEQLFLSHCVLCHGPNGKGDGRMAKIVKNPPPANLRLSRLPDSYLLTIISKGGEAVKRSPQMPPWGDQFNQREVLSVIEYIKTLRD